MVSFEDLPFEIRYMIIEQTLPDIPTEIRHAFPSTYSKPEKEFRGNVLRIAATSRSFSTIVLRIIEVLEQQISVRLKFITPTQSMTRLDFHAEFRAIKQRFFRRHLVLNTRQSLQRVAGVLVSGATKS